MIKAPVAPSQANPLLHLVRVRIECEQNMLELPPAEQESSTETTPETKSTWYVGSTGRGTQLQQCD